LVAIIGVIATLVLAVAVVMVLLRTGGSKALSDNAGLIGALVALGGVFTAQMVGISLDDRRAQQARVLEAQRAHEAALQNYLNDVGELLIEKPLREASPSDNLSTVVRAQTLSVLEGLDPDRKRILLLFLYESGLIHKDKPVVSLAAADLGGARLLGADLRAARLGRAHPGKAFLRWADLFRANLKEADLRGAYLRGAKLWQARGSTEEQLMEAGSLEGATMPDGQKYENWIKDKEGRK
jgi:hypothetical protein